SAEQHSKRSNAMWKLRERLKKQEEEKQNRPIDLLLPFGLRRGIPGQMFKSGHQTLEEHLEPLAKIPGLNGRLSEIGSSFLMETYRIISIEQQTHELTQEQDTVLLG
ncbi:MAG: hypothetical protein ACYCSV_12945, partial [Leptospirillum sp.]